MALKEAGRLREALAECRAAWREQCRLLGERHPEAAAGALLLEQLEESAGESEGESEGESAEGHAE
ncbi:hypothetical protein [Streptomyces sp. ODS28]|uniref:hypothetical protein n=1 Tax=Streptomyces sp. ODS28 TaxID=3136688 RepID=UPI0031E73E0D